MYKPLYYILLFLISISIPSCLSEDNINIPFNSIIPVNLQDGLTVSTPISEKVNEEALIKIYQELYEDHNMWSIRSFLVFRNGKLISELYYKDRDDIVNRQLIWSCTKQVMGVLTGIAIQEGIISSIDDPISDYFDKELLGHTEKGDITIGDLITMRSGIDYENDGPFGETHQLLSQKPKNSVGFILNRPMLSSPGSEFYYKDGDPHLLSALIQKLSGKHTDIWADEVFFSKIGFSNYEWTRYKDGVTLGGFGISTTPRELAKIALCVANNGFHNGEQIIPTNWVKEMTSVKVFRENKKFSFGYYWWIDNNRNIHFMWGHGGQYAFIIPNKDIVVVITSIPNTQGNAQIEVDEILPFIDKIIDIAQ